MDSNLYSMGAFFCDRHPHLVDDVVAQSDAIQDQGLREYAEAQDLPVETVFQTLVTGLAVRYFKAVAG
jgi:hypothetical protein